jgi:endonuclease I
MPTHRRRVVALLAATLVWSSLALGVPTAAPADPAPAPRAAARDLDAYYAGTAGLTGATLAARLNEIVRGHTRLSYGQVYDALPLTDADPDRAGYLIDFYSGTSVLASKRCSSSCPSDSWNREHTWAQSHGDLTTNAGPGTDMHHMRPEFSSTNSSRGNLDFDNGGTANVPLCTLCKRDGDSFEPRDAVKGDLARGLMYMAVRYEGDAQFSRDLKLNDRTCNGSGAGNHGKLSTLVAWSLADPPDARERARNDMIDADYQHNRNPFVDHPEWVTAIFGDGVGAGPQCGSTTGTEYLPGGSTPSANQPPTTAPMSFATAEDTTATYDLVARDPDGDQLTWTVTGAPTRGTASVAGRTLTYTPSRDVHGTDVVDVTVSDGRGGTASTTVTVTVTPVDDAPSAADLAATTDRDTAVRVDLVGSDVDGDPLTFTASDAAHGDVTVSGATATYTPDAGYAGPDTFTYTASDGRLVSPPATVTVTVRATPRAPVASSSTHTTPEDVPVTFTLPARDADGDPLTYTVTATPSLGSVSLDGAEATYVPRADAYGTDTFTWTVSDGTAFATATATVVVTPVNDPPVPTLGTLRVVQGGTAATTLAAADVDGDELEFALVGRPAHGSVVLDGTRVAYTAQSDAPATDTIRWTVSDGAATVEGRTTVVVRANSAPTASTLVVATTDVASVEFALAGADDDGDELTYAVVEQPAAGTVAVAGGTATYTPDPQLVGTAYSSQFTYTVSDGLLTSGIARVRVRVTPVNRAPSAVGTAVRTTAGAPVKLTLADLGATDPDGDALTIVSATPPAHGAVRVSPAEVTYVPSTRDGADSFVVTVADGRGATTTAPVDVRVTPRPVGLVLSAPAATRGTPTVLTVTATAPAGERPTGTVAITAGSSAVGTAVLGPDGRARITVRPTSAGSVRLVATYAGDDLHAAATSAPARLVVARTVSRPVIASGVLRRGRPGVVEVAVPTVAGAPATGRVVVTVAGRATTARLVRGAATVRVPRLPRAPRVTVVAKYAGDARYAPASVSRRLAVRP